MIEKFTRFPHASRASSLVPQAHWVSSCSLFPQESREFRDHQRVIYRENAKKPPFPL